MLSATAAVAHVVVVVVITMEKRFPTSLLYPFAGLKDLVICEVKSSDEAECIDRQPSGARSEPRPDTTGNSDLGFESVTVESGWTTVTFLKPTVPLDDQDL